MPRVFEVDGFRVYIYAPPSEHGPAHVHVLKAGGEVIVHISTGVALRAHRVYGDMKAVDVVRAVRIVAMQEEHLLKEWRKYHDE